MSLRKFLNKFLKLINIIRSQNYLKKLFQGVPASTEHHKILSTLKNVNTVIDVGANKGQFAIVANNLFKSNIYCFEPLSKPFKLLSKIFGKQSNLHLFNIAIGQKIKKARINISYHDDSSSLLPIGSNQLKIFPKTGKVGSEHISIYTLDYFLKNKKINFQENVLLKIDVQGYEYDVLKGAESSLELVKYIYIEVSFLELYSGQKLSDDISLFLIKKGFKLKSIHNISYFNNLSVQAYFLFERP